MSEFVDHLAELFGEFGPVTIRRMFGGHGVFRDGLMFGLVFDDTFYLKVDEHNRAMFETEGLPAFEYTRKRKRIPLSYYPRPRGGAGGSAHTRRMGAAGVRRGTSGQAHRPAMTHPGSGPPRGEARHAATPKCDDAPRARKRPPLSTCMALFASGCTGQRRERRSMTL